MATSGFRSLPNPQWPECDRLGWEAALQPYDPLARDAGATERSAIWGATTLAEIAGGYGFWLYWLQRTSPELLRQDPQRQTSVDRVKAYGDAMLAACLADHTRAGRLSRLGHALQLIEPNADWTWILRAAGRLKARAKPVRDLTARLQPPAEIIQLGEDMMWEAEHGRFRTDCDRAVLHRDGLMLAFLVQRPLRRRNLSSLTLHRNLFRRGEGWALELSAEETKTGMAIQASWPQPLVPQLETHLNRFRPVLLKCASRATGTDALWISKLGDEMGPAAVEVAIKARTEDHFGTAINPHAFRNIAATAVASFAPEEAPVIMGILSHRSLRTSERYYNRARLLAAADDYQSTVASLRSRCAGR